MGAETPNQVATAAGAVFLSYASQDTDAARRICDALRAAGIEVWFDQSELRGGDAWDQSIRKQIKSCALFVPVVSQHTHERAEGYFRLEWKLAVDRCHLMAADKAFLVPVVIDDTPDDDERVPEKFREIQWTRLPAGETRLEFVTRMRHLLSGESGHSPALVRTSSAAPPGSLSRLKPAGLAIAVVIATLGTYLLVEKPWTVKPAPPSNPATSADTPVAFNPPPHSIAVLPFVNLSGDKKQEYFSDGLTEELLNSLAEIEGLQVAARTSSFTFREHPDIVTVAHRLNVATVLEGSVRRSGNTVRVTTQLINAVTGFHLWSHTYDRNLGDVLKLQTDIADAVASALKVNLLGNEATKIEMGGTRNPAAFDAYLRGRKAHFAARSEKEYQTAISAFTDAIGLDPNYALAYANRSIEYFIYATHVSEESISRESLDKAQSDALKAIALAPDLGEGHVALALYFLSGLDFTRANDEYKRAVALAPGNARVLQNYGNFAVLVGRTEAGIAAARRAVVLDPLNRDCHIDLGEALYRGRQYKEALGALQEALTLDPDALVEVRGLVYYALGDFERARASCESKSGYRWTQVCLPVVYDKLGRHTDAEAALAKYQRSSGDADAYQYAEIYAQWGNTSKALEWLETALRLRDGGLIELRVDPLLDPLRKEPRFQAIERELKFPN